VKVGVRRQVSHAFAVLKFRPASKSQQFFIKKFINKNRHHKKSIGNHEQWKLTPNYFSR